MATKTYIEAIRDTMATEMRRDERVILLGEDVGVKGGVFKATDGLHKEFGDARVIDTPLAESTIAGVAIGAALAGLIPIAEIQFLDFILPAFDQLISEASKMRYRSNNAWHVPMVVRAPSGGGVHGALYHSQSFEAIFCHFPGMKVVAPGTPADAAGLLRAALRDPDPVIYLEHKRAYRLLRGDVPDGDHVVPLGKASVRREGTDLCLITYGLMTHFCLEAAEKLAADGWSCEVVDLRSLRPLDREQIVASARKCGKVLVVQEPNLFASMASEVAAIVAEECFEYLDAPVRRLGGPEIPAMPFAPPLEEFYLLNTAKIERALRDLAAY